jgi:methylthioribose-1-phosphate isomerase
LKFDRETAFGKNEKIEQRNPDEIWDRKLKPKRIIALNPAFDRTDSRLIEGIISEQGITPSTELAERLFQTKKK